MNKTTKNMLPSLVVGSTNHTATIPSSTPIPPLSPNFAIASSMIRIFFYPITPNNISIFWPILINP
jgi:hypothetical protein